MRRRSRYLFHWLIAVLAFTITFSIWLKDKNSRSSRKIDTNTNSDLISFGRIFQSNNLNLHFSNMETADLPKRTNQSLSSIKTRLNNRIKTLCNNFVSQPIISFNSQTGTSVNFNAIFIKLQKFTNDKYKNHAETEYIKWKDVYTNYKDFLTDMENGNYKFKTDNNKSYNVLQ